MNTIIKTAISIAIFLFATSALCQNSEIVELTEAKTYKYVSYHDNGQIKNEIGFYAKKPYKSIEEFESKLKEYKIKEHGEKKEFYSSGQLKEIVVYKKGKVIEYAKTYFEDGEQFLVTTDELAVFQFSLDEHQLWLAKRVEEVESKYGIKLKGNGIIALEISENGTIKSVKARTKDEDQKKYLIEIGEQIKVIKPAMKDGQNIGTKFAFKLQL